MAKVNVPQQSGEISISRAGGEPVKYSVKSGIVDVDDVDLDGFLRQIPESSLAGTPSKKEA